MIDNLGRPGHIASLYHFIDVSTFYLITCVLNTAHQDFSTRWCCLPDIQPVLPDSPANASLLLLIDLLLYFTWQCMRTQCALVVGVAITSRCDEDVSPPHTHTHTHISVAVGIHFLSHGKGTRIDRMSREMLGFLCLSANVCMLSSWGLAKVHQESHDVYHMYICSSEDKPPWVHLHKLFAFSFWF